MVKGYSGADRALAYLFNNATEVSFAQIQTSGTPIGTITIDGESATIYQQASGGNVKDVLVDGVSVVDANGDAQLNSADFGTPVEANPVEPATDDLTTIKIGTTVYDLPSGGGSSYLASDFYSTDEEVVGSWTDDKPVYQKTISLSSLSAGANNVTITNLEHLVSSKSFIIHNNTEYLEVPYFGENYSSGVISEQACYVYSEAGKVVLFINTELLTDYTKAVLTVQYTKSTDAAGTAPTRNNLIYIPTLYSERERQVGVWTDGKPLYQKTYRNISITNNADNIIDSNFGTDKIICTHDIEFRGISGNYRNDYNNSVSDTLYSNNGQLIYYFYKTGSWSQMFDTLDVTIQYTKTTDTAGSGRWTPTGQYAHHYSTDEQIIGTWIDGSTVYEKTQNGGITISANDTWYDTAFTGINKVISFNCSLLRDGEEIGSSFNNGHIDYVVRNNIVKIKGYNFSIGDHFTLDKLTIQYTKSSS